jgi:UDP-N-acetyl-D-mannosaminuronic acid dehydrogenase
MNKAKKIIVFNDISIKEALFILNKTEEKILICVNRGSKFFGVINDGDIRRAILNGAKINSSIEDYINTTPITVNKNTNVDQLYTLLNDRVLVIPVINAFQKVLGYYSYRDKIKSSETLSSNVVVLGLGYVGLTLSAILSDTGFRVYGFDLNKTLISNLRKKKLPFYERGLSKYIENNSSEKKISFINKLKKDLGSIYIITVGTPINYKNKKPYLKSIKTISKNLAIIIKKNDLIILRSTIPVGCTRTLVIPILEKFSGLKVGIDFFISFAPERTAEGAALLELKLNPQIIGGYDYRSYELTARFFNKFTRSTVYVPSLEAAELSKLMDNSYRDHKFAYVNQFINFCEKLKIDLPSLVDSINHGYPRNNIPKPSPGVGGPCLSKDPYILSYCFKKNNINNNTLILNSRQTNEMVIDYLLRKLIINCNKIKKNINKVKIFLIGMAFKGEPITSDIRNSTSVEFLDKLPNKKNVKIFDCVAYKKDLQSLGAKVSNLQNGFKGSDVVIILNNHPLYENINIYKLINTMKKPGIFIDCWNVFDSLQIKKIKGIIYSGLGVD